MVKAIPFTKKMMQMQARKSLRGLPIEAVAGIGRVLGNRLRELGIRTALALKTRTKRMSAEKFVRWMKRAVNANCRQSVMSFETLRGRLSRRSIEKACRSRVLGGRLRETRNAIVSRDNPAGRRTKKNGRRLNSKGKDRAGDCYDYDAAYITEGHATLNTNGKSPAGDPLKEDADTDTTERERKPISIQRSDDSSCNPKNINSKLCCKNKRFKPRISYSRSSINSHITDCFKQCNNLHAKHIDLDKINYINRMLNDICKEGNEIYKNLNVPNNVNAYDIQDLETRKQRLGKYVDIRKSIPDEQHLKPKSVKMGLGLQTSSNKKKSQEEFDEWFAKFQCTKKPLITKSQSLMEFNNRTKQRKTGNYIGNKRVKKDGKPVSKISSSYYLLVV